MLTSKNLFAFRTPPARVLYALLQIAKKNPLRVSLASHVHVLRWVVGAGQNQRLVRRLQQQSLQSN